MEVLHYPGDSLDTRSRSAVTIGAYDGVHLGHRQLLEKLKAAATEIEALSVVVTFDRHPALVVRPDSAPRLLTDLDQKLELLASTGVDLVMLVHFDAERASEPAEDFAEEMLAEALHARSVIVGHDFHFGAGRAGDVSLLQDLGVKLGFEVTGINLVGEPQGPPISSTRIRALLAKGDVVGASELLGRHHEVRGVVGHGDARGRELGFPTANVSVPDEILVPGDGVYSGWYLRPDGSAHPSAISVGRRPTFYQDARTSLVEAHLLDFTGHLYDEPGRVVFTTRIRGQERFSGPDALAALTNQIREDVSATRAALADRQPT